MARINRSDVIQKAVNDLSISTSSDKIPNETLDKVQLTYDLNKKTSNFIISNNQSTSGTLINTLPLVSGEIFLTGVTASFIKDAANDLATGRIFLSIVPNDSNVATAIINFSVITLTADSKTVALSLPYPIKLKAGSQISMTGAYGLGLMTRSYTCIGYITSSN